MRRVWRRWRSVCSRKLAGQLSARAELSHLGFACKSRWSKPSTAISCKPRLWPGACAAELTKRVGGEDGHRSDAGQQRERSVPCTTKCMRLRRRRQGSILTKSPASTLSRAVEERRDRRKAGSIRRQGHTGTPGPALEEAPRARAVQRGVDSQLRAYALISLNVRARCRCDAVTAPFPSGVARLTPTLGEKTHPRCQPITTHWPRPVL